MDLNQPDLLLSDEDFTLLLAGIPDNLGPLVKAEVQVLPIKYALQHAGRLYLAIWSHADKEAITHLFGAELVPASEWMGQEDNPHPLYGKRVEYEGMYYTVDDLVLFSTEVHLALHKALLAGILVPDTPPPEPDGDDLVDFEFIDEEEQSPDLSLLVPDEELKEKGVQIQDSATAESKSGGSAGERFENYLLAFQSLEMDFATVHRKGLRNVKEAILIRFRQGVLIDASMGEHQRGQAHHGEASVILETWEDGTGYRKTEIYRWRQVARVMKTEQAVQKWIEKQLEQSSGTYPTVSWSALKNHCRKSLRATEDGSDDSETTAERFERLLVQLERRTNQLRADAEGLEHELMEIKGEIPDNLFDEAMGVVAKALEDAGDTTGMLGRLEYEKPERATDEEHLAYVRLRPCCICGKEQGIDAHHLRKGGMGTKGPDLYAAPLCREHHREVELSPVGEDQCWAAWEVNPWEVVCRLLAHRIDSRVTLPD